MLYLIASYPKSGNTYVRIFLSHYLRGNDNLNDVGFPLYNSKFYFPDGFPDDSKDRHPICRHHPSFAKTHEVSDNFHPPSAEKALYIVRNPLDVAPSWADHTMSTIDHAVESMAKNMRLRGTENSFPVDVGSWSSHVRGWLQHSRIPVRAVRYETLKANPRRAFRIIIDWFELPFNQSRFDSAIAFSSFDNLQKTEFKKGFKESRSAHGFFRKGQMNDWVNTLTVAQANRIRADHGLTMKLLGY